MSKKQKPVYACDHCQKDMGDNEGFHFDTSGYDNNTTLFFNKRTALSIHELEDKNFCCTRCLMNHLENVITNNLE